MNYYQMQEVKKEVYPAILLDSWFSPRVRKFFIKLFFWITVTLILEFFWPFFSLDFYALRSLTILFASFYFIFVLLESMYRYYYFYPTTVDIRVLMILDKAKKTDDITVPFLKHELGQYVMYRLGFSKKEIDTFLKQKTDKVTKNEFEIIQNDDNEVSFAEFGFSLIHFDSDLAALCRKKGVTVASFKKALDWIAELDKKTKDKERWWTRENLLRIQSIGKNISFGQIYYLEQLGHNMLCDTSYIQLGEKWRIYTHALTKLETILSKQIGGNIILTAKELYIAKDVIASLTRQIFYGKVFPELENKRVYVLDTTMLLTNYDSPNEFEQIVGKVFSQASDAGNVILIIPNLPEFIEQAHRMSVNIKNVLYEALDSTNLQVVALSDERSFHETIETDFDLMSVFEKVHIDESTQTQALTVLLQDVLYEEIKHKVFFTYQAIEKIVQGAERYFSELSLLDKSFDILQEVLVFCKNSSISYITSDVVDSVITSKTGISTGVLTQAEAEKIRSIELQMKEKIIGQDEAVATICDAMMRSRLGLYDSKKPLGTFLFVGPTGVGKTETAKVLAELFFGDKEQMLRSDMSEYSSSDSVTRMIGRTGEVGLFASKVREKGSGVLLLDEFEKASSDVHNLFLQIIDEGFFTDGRGERVMMRNFIIIATSNAGSEMWNIDSKINKEDLIDSIIARNIFKTELLNRFDDIILFNTLSKEGLEKIVHLALQDLIEKLEVKGITLIENEVLKNYLVQSGLNPLFGAREIHKVIKKEVEAKIAHALVLGDLFQGDTISFTVINNALEIQKYT